MKKTSAKGSPKDLGQDVRAEAAENRTFVSTFTRIRPFLDFLDI